MSPPQATCSACESVVGQRDWEERLGRKLRQSLGRERLGSERFGRKRSGKEARERERG